MRYVDIASKVLKKEYWKYEKGAVYYNKHIYRYSPIETAHSCGNCDGARCDDCKLITEPDHWSLVITSDIYCNIVKEAILESEYNIDEKEATRIAEELTYWDGSYIRNTDVRIKEPTEEDLKNNYPDFYKELINNSSL